LGWTALSGKPRRDGDEQRDKGQNQPKGQHARIKNNKLLPFM
jgi:hypothetical protein